MLKWLISKFIDTQKNDKELTEQLEKANSKTRQITDICSRSLNREKDDAEIPCPINWNNAMKYCGDEKVIRRIAASTLDECPGYIESLIQSAADHNRTDSVYYAHKLRGSTLNLGITELSELSEQAESAAGEEDFHTVEILIPQIEEQFQTLKSFLQTPNWTETAKNTTQTSK